ncbi:TetR/AcrR family transcriptional regulator [Kribbella sp. NPDC051718]|uniref:TetR/AcrR family transcriptional regulator n=1 Tax=Kribbella sp. NPDC051718 TaxID=3155168 RepID=UPI003431D0D0
MAGVRQFDETAVVEQALGVFWEKGYRATSMLDLAAATGVQRGSLYHAYGGKEQLFTKIFSQFAEDFLAGAERALEPDDPRQALTDLFDYCIASITTGTPSRGCLSTRTAVEAAEPQVDAAVQAMLDSLEERVANMLTRTTSSSAHAGARASARARSALSVPPRDAARLVVAMTRGLAVLERVYGDPARLRETAATLVTALLR